MTTLRRAISTTMVLALLMAITAIPALAAAVANASIITGDLLSGQGGQITIKIDNTGAAGSLIPGLGGADSAINAIQIEAPVGIYDTDSVQLPDGWEGGYDDEIGFIYGIAVAEGSEIAPGASMNVTLNGTAKRIADDASRTIPVFVSDDEGMTLASAGAPSVTSRILEITSSVIVKPAGATNTDLTQVTANQDNVDVTVAVINHGSDARTVNVAVAKASGSSDITSTPTAVSIPANSTARTTTFDVVFGGAGTLNLDATAVSDSSAANTVRMATITVQPKFAGTYVPDSLAPRTVVQGDDVAFALRVNKTGAQPALLATTLSFTGFTTETTVDFAGGNSNNITITFPETTVDEDLDNGTFGTTLNLVGADANGAVINVNLTPQSITLDNLLPYVDLFANVGTSAVEGATPAAGNGRSITFSGSVSIGQGADATACTNCRVDRAVVVTNTGAELPFTLTNSNGTLSGSSSFTFPADTTSARAEITVSKVSGLLGSGASNTFEVDIIAPVIAEARTQRNGSDDTILVTMTELVDMSSTRGTDWGVDNNLVLSATPVGTATATTQVVLELAQQFEDTNATPAVTYERFGVNGTVYDRVELDFLDEVKEAVDGITPEAPVIASVAGLGLQDGEFWTNQSQPTVGLDNLIVGDIIDLYFDANDDGVAQSTERIFRGAAQGTSDEVTITTDLGDIEISRGLIATMMDAGGNFSPAVTETLNLDFTVPVIVDMIVDPANGNLVTAVFSEPIPRGRDAAFDWTVLATQNGEQAHRTVTSVAFDTASTRILDVSTASYDPADGDIDGIRFKSRGGVLYEDRATNQLANQLYTD